MRSIEQNKKLCERYPFLIPRNVWTDKICDGYNYSYIRGDGELPKGWLKLFLQMCEDIRQPLIDADYLDKFRFSQIKEKYGTMRCYNFGATEKVQDILHKYEYISQFVCQTCGKPATIMTNGWIASYCNDCCVDDGNEGHEAIEFDCSLRITGYNADGQYERIIDCSDEWKRLYEQK